MTLKRDAEGMATVDDFTLIDLDAALERSAKRLLQMEQDDLQGFLEANNVDPRFEGATFDPRF
jgi:hypothetical protein